MPEPRVFPIRRAFVVPLGLLPLLVLALLAVCVLQGQPTAKAVLLGVLLLPLTALFVESAGRRLLLDATGITACRPFRRRRVDFATVTSLETVQVRSRAFLTLVAGDDDFLIISNSYRQFPQLVAELVAAVPPAAVTEETRRFAANPSNRPGDIVAVWLAVVAMVYVLAAQFTR